MIAWEPASVEVVSLEVPIGLPKAEQVEVVVHVAVVVEDVEDLLFVALRVGRVEGEYAISELALDGRAAIVQVGSYTVSNRSVRLNPIVWEAAWHTLGMGRP